MKLLRVLLSPLFSFLLLAGHCSARPDKVPRSLMGGYSQVEEVDDQIRTAASVAVQALRVGGAATYSFVPNLPSQFNDGDVHIIRAFSQVVAGLNYRLVLAIVPAAEGDDEECLGAFAVTIYNHFGDMSVTQWGQEITCTRAMAALQNASDLKNPLAGEFNG